MTHLKLITAFCLIFTATTGLAMEDYYVWIDENGVVNYSEKNPPGQNARRISESKDLDELRNSPDARRPGRRPTNQSDDESEQEEPTPAPESLAQSSDDEVDPDEIAREERAEIEKKIAEVKRKNCEVGKKNLAQLQAYSRIRVKDENGEERILGDEEKQAKIAEAREVIRENCTQ